MKKAILLFLVITIMLGTMTPLSAKTVTEPVFYIAFEQLEGGHLNNFAKNSFEIVSNNVSSVEGVRGVGVEIDKRGYITSPENKIGNMLAGSNGVTMSAYVKDGFAADGDIITVYNKNNNVGLRLSKRGSVITVSASSDENEILKSVSFDTKEGFKSWTHIAASVSYSSGKICLYVNGKRVAAESIDFMSTSYYQYGASTPDSIGTIGMCLDEVRIHPAALAEDDIKAMLENDKNEPEETPYIDILADNLVAHFAFDEGEGLETKSTGMAEITGVAQNENLTWIDGVKGSAIQFHKAYPNWFDIGHGVTDALVGADGLTVTGWLFITKEQGSGYQNRILSLNISHRALLHFTASSSQILLCATRSDPEGNLTGLNYQNTSKFTFGEWHFFVMTTDLVENEMHFYLDGQELTAMQNGGTIKTNYSAKEFSVAPDRINDAIGADSTSAGNKNTMNGALDELKIYNRSISKEEADYLYVENKNGSWITREEADFNTLKGYSNDAVFMALDHNEVISQERRKRIDWDDFDATPVLRGTTTMVPVKLLTEYLGAEAEVDLEAKTAKIGNLVFTADSLEYTMSGSNQTLKDAPFIKGNTMYVPLRVVAQQLGKAIYYHDSGVLAVGEAETVKKFSSDEDYVLWFHDALTKLHYVQQTADHYSTRQVVRYEPNLRLWHSSPSAVKLEDGTLLFSHDTAGRGTTIFRSDDNGETWYEIHYTEYMVYGGLFENKGSAYCMGVRRGTGEPAVPTIIKSDDGGLTWTEPQDNKTGWLIEDDGTSLIQPAHTAPTPVIKKDGRIYRAFDTSGSGWKQFKVFMISADEDADLLDRNSWTITNPVFLGDHYNVFPEGFDYYDAGMCEANAVIGPDGKMYTYARFNSAPELNWAAICRLEDDNTLVFDRIVKFPGGMTKFVIRYDESTGKWIALANPNTEPDYSLERICLCLLVSDDFYNWRIAETLLVPDWLDNYQNYMSRNAFQYPDWFFDGEDIVYAVREANQGAHSFHNGNYNTLYRLKDYKKYLDNDITEEFEQVVYDRMLGR